MDNKITDLFKSKIESIGMTLSSLSRKVAIPYSRLYRLLNEHASWTVVETLKVGKILGITPEEIYALAEV